MSGSRIESIALDWMAARMVREHVHKLRGECVCAHERKDPTGAPFTEGVPCWKTTYQATSDRRDYETGEPLDVAWVRHREPMCPACVKRDELHQRLIKARKREGGLHARLTRECRIRVMDGDVIAEVRA